MSDETTVEAANYRNVTVQQKAAYVRLTISDTPPADEMQIMTALLTDKQAREIGHALLGDAPAPAKTSKENGAHVDGLAGGYVTVSSPTRYLDMDAIVVGVANRCRGEESYQAEPVDLADARDLRDALDVALGEGRATSDKPFKDAAAESDIRKGDRICTKRSVEGVMHTCTGVAHEQVNGEWWTEQGGCLNTRDIRVIPLITIFERPEIEWKPGDIVLDGDDDAWRMDDDRDWYRITEVGDYLSTEELVNAYGPIRRAKIVEADS